MAIFTAFFQWSAATAQTTDVGSPKSWLSKAPLKEARTTQLPEIDVEQLKLEDEINRANHSGPWRFGFPHEVETDLLAHGTRDVAYGGGHIYRMTFTSEGALSMNLFFHKFNLPEGAFLHVYNNDRTALDGAYTAANNQPDGMLSTIPIIGEEITVEYFEPSGMEGMAELVVGTAIHGYRPVQAFFNEVIQGDRGLNDSGPCNYDTGCSDLPGNPFGSPGEWDEQIASVAVMMNNGFSFCTGALVNNTANDGTPYFLSANHCGTSGGGGLTMLFGWESPNPSCATNTNSTNGPTTDMVNGAILRANRSGSDFALWELSTTPPLSYNVYYAGWDRTGDRPSEVTGIHHPSGDVKKICKEEDSPYQSTAAGADVWWVDDWEWGVTEPGSSGSPIFDQNKRIVGQLYGGLAACSGTSNNGSYDYYGRFDVSWNAGGSASARLSDWLDPLGTGQTAIDGYNPNAPAADLDAGLTSVASPLGSLCGETSFEAEVTLRNFGIQTLTSASITYGLQGESQQTYSWTGSLATGETTVLELPSYSFSGEGALTFSASVSIPNGDIDENPSNNTTSSVFDALEQGEEASLEILFDCWGSEVTWELVDGNAQIVAQGGPYSNGTEGTFETASFCLAEGCYTFTIFDSFGDGLEGSAYGSCGVDGNYQITDAAGNVLIEMGAANYGDEDVRTFCIEESEPVDVPCEDPYPTVTGLDAQVLSNGVQLSWNPIPGSKGCLVQGGPTNLSTSTTSIEIIEDDLDGFFVPASQLPFANEIYRWRVRCGCSRNPTIAGSNSPYSFFLWQGATAEADGSAIEVMPSAMQLFPNPTSGSVTLRLQVQGEGKALVRVFDLSGRMVYSENLALVSGDNLLELDLGSLSAGMYVTRIEGGSHALTERLVIQK